MFLLTSLLDPDVAQIGCTERTFEAHNLGRCASSLCIQPAICGTDEDQAVARTLEPVKETLRAQKEPATPLMTDIWRLAGQVLMDNPDCPVEVSKAVHTLMGVPPPEGPDGSPVSQANAHQDTIDQALQVVSQAAQERLASWTGLRQQLQQSTPYDAAAEAERIQREATQILSSALARVSSNCQSPSLQAGGLDLERVGTEMAPICQQLAESKMAMHRCNALTSNAAHITERAGAFQPLLAAAVATQSQQIQSLSRYQAADARARLSSAPAADSEAGLEAPITSPVRRQAAAEKKAKKRTFEQTQEMQEPPQSMSSTARAAQSAAAPASNASIQPIQYADVWPGNIYDDVATVYPGHDGEPFWTMWLGMHPKISDYLGYSQLYHEWTKGILYSSTLRRTVPLAQLEQDRAEGKQVKDSAYEPWRMLPKWAMLHERKIIIYSMLGARHHGQDMDDFMEEYHLAAEAAVSHHGAKRGRKPCYMTSLLKALEGPFKEKYGTVVEFEKNVLGWKHTTSNLAQASSRQRVNGH